MAAIFDSDPRLLHDVQVGASHHQGGVSTGKREREGERERERESEIRTGVNIRLFFCYAGKHTLACVYQRTHQQTH